MKQDFEEIICKIVIVILIVCCFYVVLFDNDGSDVKVPLQDDYIDINK